MDSGRIKINEINERICVIPGTFDPVTNGHLDVIFRASNLFDKVYATALENSAKKTMFNLNDRRKMLELACEEFGGLKNVTADATSELLVDYVRAKNAGFIVKSIRNIGDFDYEYSMFLINREIGNNIETVFFPAKNEYLYISSTFVREMILYKRDVSKYVPEKVNEFICSRFRT